MATYEGKCTSSKIKLIWMTGALTHCCLSIFLPVFGFDHSEEPLAFLFHVSVHMQTCTVLQARGGKRCIIHTNAVTLSN